MALIKCPECGQELSDSVKRCHHCGMKIKRAKEKKIISKKKKIIIWIVSIVAVAAMAVGGVFCFNKVIKPANDYKSANKLLDDGKYEDAVAAFEVLGAYKDSEDKIKEAKYRHANYMVEQEHFDDALAIYELLDGYSESNSKIKETYYKKAISEYNNGAYLDAKKDFQTSGNYGDTAIYLLKIEDIEKKEATEEAHRKNVELLKNAYDAVKGNSRITLASDGLSITVDSKNKYDISSFIDISTIISKLKLPDSLYDAMVSTNSLMGRQNETYNAWNVSWSYHPDNGLDVIFKLVE